MATAMDPMGCSVSPCHKHLAKVSATPRERGTEKGLHMWVQWMSRVPGKEKRRGLQWELGLGSMCGGGRAAESLPWETMRTNTALSSLLSDPHLPGNRTATEAPGERAVQPRV